MSTEKEREEDALAKATLIMPLLNENLTEKDRINKQKELAEKAGLDVRTIKRYVSKYKEKGFEGLKRKKREVESNAKISDEVVAEAIILRRENPQRSVSDIIKILEMEKVIEPGSVARSTLQLHMQDAGYSRKQMNMYLKPITGKAATRFQKEHRMQLLQGDGKYGPYLPIGKNGEMVRTYFICWIDDYSRYVVYGRFYSSFEAVDVLDSLKQAITRFGIPECIYTDRGKQYIAKTVQLAGAILQIEVKAAKPFSPESKGKVEFYNNLLNKFISEVPLENFQTLKQLNDYYEVWQEKFYHSAIHGTINTSPNSAFFSDPTPLKFVDPELLERAVKDTGERKVAKDGTISIDGKTYIVENLNLVGFKVMYSRSPSNKDDIIIYKKGFENCRAFPITIGSDIDYEARNSMITADKGIIKTDKSRMLRGLAKLYKEEHPDTKLELERPLSVKEEELSNFISYSSKEDNKDD